MASGCVFNNIIDRDIDAKMHRTKNRHLVDESVSVQGAFVFGAALLALGIFLLVMFTNRFALAAAAVGFVVYVIVYSLWAKRHTMYATEVGSIAGAVPPVVGYCAASNTFDVGALTLFFILCFWQMPHFFAIALRRMEEYSAAGIPVLPLQKGIRTTKIRMTVYLALFIGAASSLALQGYVGFAYLIVLMPVSLAWFVLCVRGFWVEDTKRWARSMFFVSLIVLLLFALMITLDGRPVLV